MNREATFWDYLRKLLPPDIHYDRIESDTSPGHPDIRYTLDGVTGTIELKSTDIERPYPFSGKSGLRKSQIDWIRREYEASGYVILALQYKKSQVYLLSGELYADLLHEMTFVDIDRVAGAAWVKGEPPDRIRSSIRYMLLNKP